MSFVLTTREEGSSWARRDPVASVHTRGEEARDALVDYGRDNWDSGMDGDELPVDGDEMADMYFEVVPESCDIAETAQ